MIIIVIIQEDIVFTHIYFLIAKSLILAKLFIIISFAYLN